METQRNKPANFLDTDSFEGIYSGDFQERLTALLAINAETEREKSLFRTDQEKIESAMMKNPIPVKQAFAYFGLMLGSIIPASIFLKAIVLGQFRIGPFLFLFFINLVCALTGYFSGKLIGKMVFEMENRSWNFMLSALPFIGILWGIITGGTGGIFIFLIGAVAGAVIAAMVGGIAVPAFAIFHRLLKKGEMIERNQFLPLALGITFIISAFILGL